VDERLTFGSGFTGVGGFDRGFELAGMRCVWQSEIDAFCLKVLEKHWPDVLRVRDIRGVTASTVPGVDVFCGGSPCQDLSVAGLRAGLDGDRSGLFFEFARVADELVRPGGWVVFENVPGLLSSPGRDRETGVDRTGRDFAIVLATLADIGFHDLAWRVLDSRYFGVPQRRRRVYIVGRRATGGSAREVLLEPASGGGDFTTGAEAESGDPFGISVSTLQSRKGRTGDTSAEAAAGGQLIAGTVRSHMRPGSNAFDLAIAGPLGGGNDGIGRRSKDDPNLVLGEQSPGGRGERDRDVAQEQRRRQAGTELPGGEDRRIGASSHAHGVRASPELPGWVDDPKPDGPRYSAMGNAVTVNVLKWIGERIVSTAASPSTEQHA
jgi:DNA-cytosine methyltransferase